MSQGSRVQCIGLGCGSLRVLEVQWIWGIEGIGARAYGVQQCVGV